MLPAQNYEGACICRSAILNYFYMTTTDCLICAEHLTLDSWTNCSCCSSTCCHSCLYRHITTVLEEGMTGNRRPMVCPLGCGTALSDLDIRTCFHRQHGNLIWDSVGNALFWLMTIVNKLSSSLMGDPIESTWSWWWYLLHTELEREDLLRYETWSQTVAFADMTKKHDDVILRCPSADCGFAWVVADNTARRRKQRHEAKHFYMWYEPPKPEKVPLDWVEPDYLNIDVTGWIAQDIDEPRHDGRRMTCGKCAHVFCGLCRNPWMYANMSHRAIPCARYRARLPVNWNGQDLQNWEHTRGCPGCELRTSRIDGCNHMTCPCGYEWCYICEVRWNPLHYACVEDQRRLRRRGGRGTCMIS